MPAPAVRRIALAAAPALLACALSAPPGAATPPEPTPVARIEIGPVPVVVDPQAADELVPASQVVPEPGASLTDRGQGPLVAVGLAVLALVGAFVAGLSRRPDPVD